MAVTAMFVDTASARPDVREADAKGQFKEMDDVVRSLSADRPTSAKRSVKSGHGDPRPRCPSSGLAIERPRGSDAECT